MYWKEKNATKAIDSHTVHRAIHRTLATASQERVSPLAHSALRYTLAWHLLSPAHSTSNP
ncbi:hypothetical protein KIM372_03680 [Bombiscardovia nodaiensis]|uniref:Integrase n=1 Tax=Bombiscardovia nodaiensis TaxID=2932181 RepID=A0ABN6SCC8_9BIFI|nr:hypothetical protein KIM372_03680 [Bombiscardovia nodaiensis]